MRFARVLRSQRTRAMHRRTGWWLAAACVLNVAWIALFAGRMITVSQIVLIALLVCLAVALVRLTATPARCWADRLLVHTPVALYAGWVTVATVAGAATTTTAWDLAVPSEVGLSAAAGAVALTAAVACLVVARARAAAGYAAAVCWALVWIAVGTTSHIVLVTALAAALLIVVVLTVRLARSADPAGTALG